jgi:uncharacterized membrane protein YbhN (UPF0104 family)
MQMSAITASHPSLTGMLKSRIARRLIGVAVISVAIVSLVLAVPGLQGVAADIEHLQVGWVIAAMGFELGSCLGFVLIFRRFFDDVPAGRARELAWLEQGAGALLPGGGVGALAIGGWFLRREGLPTRTIIKRSSALFFLTSAINVLALVGAGALLALGIASGPGGLLRAWLPVGGGLAVGAVVLASPILLRRSAAGRRPPWLSDLAAGLDGARESMLRPSWRLVGALAYLGLDIAALGATFTAAGHALPVAPLVLAYLIGYLANLIPVPGGFGVLEGGLAGALIAYGAPATQAAAAVIVYHAIAFWIPSLGGLIGYALLRDRLDDRDGGPAEASTPCLAASTA